MMFKTQNPCVRSLLHAGQFSSAALSFAACALCACALVLSACSSDEPEVESSVAHPHFAAEAEPLPASEGERAASLNPRLKKTRLDLKADSLEIEGVKYPILLAGFIDSVAALAGDSSIAIPVFEIMAKNLNVATESGSWCYGDDPANCETYGRLYDWATAQTVCPEGWKLSRPLAWGVLAIASTGSWTINPLKAATLWQHDPTGTGNGTDYYGFAALPGGDSYLDGTGARAFELLGQGGSWWTDLDDETAVGYAGSWDDAAVAISFYYDDAKLYYGPFYKTAAASVRCAKNLIPWEELE